MIVKLVVFLSIVAMLGFVFPHIGTQNYAMPILCAPDSHDCLCPPNEIQFTDGKLPPAMNGYLCEPCTVKWYVWCLL